MFDLLYFNGEPLVKKPLQERRKLLRENFNEVGEEFRFASSVDVTTMEEVQEYLEESVKGRHFSLRTLIINCGNYNNYLKLIRIIFP